MSRRSFMATIADLRSGRTQDDLTDQLSALVKAVRETGRAGKLTLTLSVKPASKESTIMLIDDVVTATLPKPDRAASLMFSTSDGSLDLNDPDAVPKENLRSVKTPEPGLREVAQ